MGMYVYRVTAEKRICSDGNVAFVAKFAYKPYYGERGGPENHAAEMKTGCYASRRMVANMAQRGERVERITMQDGGAVFSNPHNWATFLDDCNLGVEGRLPRIPNVTAPAA